jgi:hypothetical protein
MHFITTDGIAWIEKWRATLPYQEHAGFLPINFDRRGEEDTSLYNSFSGIEYLPVFSYSRTLPLRYPNLIMCRHFDKIRSNCIHTPFLILQVAASQKISPQNSVCLFIYPSPQLHVQAITFFWLNWPKIIDGQHKLRRFSQWIFFLTQFISRNLLHFLYIFSVHVSHIFPSSLFNTCIS